MMIIKTSLLLLLIAIINSTYSQIQYQQNNYQQNAGQQPRQQQYYNVPNNVPNNQNYYDNVQQPHPQPQPHPQQQQFQRNIQPPQIRPTRPHPSAHPPQPHPPPQQTYSSRSGTPFSSLMTRAKSWLGQKDPSNRRTSVTEDNLPPKMRDLHRVPKPPKYPLYDLDQISMATPPPAPAMHPMSALPTDDLIYEPKITSRNGQRQRRPSPRPNSSNNNRRPRPRPPRPSPSGPPPPMRSQQRMSQPHPQQNNQRKKLKKHENHVENNQEYFDHPMASNLDPVKTSPALGRPLGYDEYMARPAHSYVNDPWNFDPFATQMNQGLNTHALKYNYDPLGMNNLEMSGNNPSMSHLDPGKLSYPGDTHALNSNNKDQLQGGSNTFANNNYNENTEQYNGNVVSNNKKNSFTKNAYANSGFNNNYNNNYNNNNNYDNSAAGSSYASNYDQAAGNYANNGNYGNNNYGNNNYPNNNNGNYGNNNNGNNYGNYIPSTMDSASSNIPQNNNNNQEIEITPIKSNNGKIEFTIETSNNGQALINVNSDKLSDLSDQYNPYSNPYGPSGYDNSPKSDPVTPEDMLPPPETSSNSYYGDSNYQLTRNVRNDKNSEGYHILNDIFHQFNNRGHVANVIRGVVMQ